MMTYATKSKSNVKKFAEVFTPAGAVFSILLTHFRPELEDVDKTFLDPATGEGQFPCAELVLKLFYSCERLDEDLALRALNSLHGIDIQAASVAKAKEHLRLTLAAAYEFFSGKKFRRWDEAEEILANNFIVGDSLELMRKWAQPQQSLF